MANDPKSFRIPKYFTLFGHRYSVSVESDLYLTESCYGTASDNKKLIRLQDVGMVTYEEEDVNAVVGQPKKLQTVEITNETVIETFYHELGHIIFTALGEDELSGNEKLINMIGKAMLEVFLTSEYGNEKK